MPKNKNQIILEIAKSHRLLKSHHECDRYDIQEPLRSNLESSNTGADFFEASIVSVKEALIEAYNAGKKAGLQKAKS